MAEKSIRRTEASTGDFLAFRDAFELGAESESRIIQRLDVSGGKVLTPRDAARRGVLSTLTAADSFDLTALPSELLNALLPVRDGRVLHVAVDQYVTGGTGTITPILFDDAKPPNVVGILSSQTFVQPFTHRRGASTGTYFPLTVLSWDVTGARKIGLHLSAISGTSNYIRVWAWIDGVVPPYSDQFFRAVSLLLPMDGDDGSLVFLDYSQYNQVTAASGNAHIEVDQSKFGGASVYLDGNGDYLTVTANVGLELTTGDFTIEGWIRPASVTGDHVIIMRGASNVSSGNDLQYAIYTSGSNLVCRPYASTTDYNFVIGTVAVNNWYHFAFVRKNDTFMGFLDGAKSANTKTITTLLNQNAAWNVYIGDMNIGGTHAYFNGYIDDIRITKGVARYVANFTPPAAAYSVIEFSDDDPHYWRTNLLLHGQGANNATTILDSSWSPKVVTCSGDAKISTAQYRFGSSSLYFDGTGDYLSLASSSNWEPGSGDFTVEFWMRPTATPGTAGFILHRYSGTGNGNIAISYRSTNKIEAYCCLTDPTDAPTVLLSTNTAPVDEWTHVAFVKKGLSYYLFFNGELEDSDTAASHPPTGLSTVLYVGRWGVNTNYMFTGYIQDLRITKGVARYITDFSVPTALYPSYRER